MNLCFLFRIAENSVEAEKDENDKDEAFTDDSAVTWLEDLGLDRRRYRSVEPSKVKEYPWQ